MNIKQLISSIGTKISLGIIAISIVIISVGHLLQTLHSYLDGLTNGYVLEFAIFGSLFLIGSIGITFLFKSERQMQLLDRKDSPVFPIEINVQSLGVKFVEGLITGLTKETQTHKD